MVPGMASPSEIELATSRGASALKFFPAETMGGVAALKAFAGPYLDARFLPTGGITPELLPNYLRLRNVVACGGSWLAPRELLMAEGPLSEGGAGAFYKAIPKKGETGATGSQWFRG